MKRPKPSRELLANTSELTIQMLALFVVVLMSSKDTFGSELSYLDQARALKPPDAKLRENGEFEGESWWNENAAIIVRFQQISCFHSLIH